MGAGGFTLAIRVHGVRLLLPRRGTRWGPSAFARFPRFVGMATVARRGCSYDNIYPADTALTTTTSIYSNHPIRSGPLTSSNGAISPMLTANVASALSPGLVSKMNLLRGIDVTFYLAHCRGALLGNFSDNDGNGMDGTWMKTNGVGATIDQVMAQSLAVYPTPPVARSIVIGPQSLSWGWQDLVAKTGAVQQTPQSPSPQKLFDALFKNGAPGADAGTSVPDAGMAAVARKPVVDRVLEIYNRYKSGTFGDARRLSAGDQVALSAVRITWIVCSDLEARLTSSPVGGSDGGTTGNMLGASCSTVTRPTSTATSFSLYNDVIAAAFLCDVTRIGTIVAYDPFVAYTGDWHQDYAHKASIDPTKEAALLESHRVFFETVFLDLANKLNVMEANGKTVLDNSLLYWTHECSWDTHNDFALPVVTAGSAAGYLNTGLYVDYRNRSTSPRRRRQRSRQLRLVPRPHVQPVAGDDAAGDGRRSVGVRAQRHAWLRRAEAVDRDLVREERSGFVAAARLR